MSVHQSGAGVEEGEREEDVLQAVDDEEIFIFSLHSPPLAAVGVLTEPGLAVPVSVYLRHQ